MRVHKDGHEVEVSIKHSPIQDEHGHIIAVSAIHRDIAERKALEKLQQDFLAMVTHELRNPLTTVKGVALILRRLREFNEEAVEALIEQTEVLERLISDLLDASRVQVGKLYLERSPVDLIPVIRACCEQIQASTGAHQIFAELPSGPLVCDCDETRVRQVLFNLLGNAIKYSGGGTILVTAYRNGDQLHVDVKDEGQGIASDSLPHLFDRFFRASEDYSAGSLGLGLYISRGIVDGHGGRIWLRAPGRAREAPSASSSRCFRANLRSNPRFVADRTVVLLGEMTITSRTRSLALSSAALRGLRPTSCYPRVHFSPTRTAAGVATGARGA